MATEACLYWILPATVPNGRFAMYQATVRRNCRVVNFQASSQSRRRRRSERRFPPRQAPAHAASGRQGTDRADATRWMFSARESSTSSVSLRLTMQGTPTVFARRFWETSRSRVRQRRPPAGAVKLGADIETGKQGAMCNIFCQLLDGDACLDFADVLLAEHQLIAWNATRSTERDCLDGRCDVFLHDGPAEPLSDLPNPSRIPLPLCYSCATSGLSEGPPPGAIRNGSPR